MNRYEQEGFPGLIREIDLQPKADASDEESPDANRTPDTDQSPDRDATIDLDAPVETSLDNLYEPRPIPTQQLLRGRPVIFGAQAFKRQLCRLIMLRKPKPKEPAAEPVVVPLVPQPSQLSQPSVSADFDPMVLR